MGVWKQRALLGLSMLLAAPAWAAFDPQTFSALEYRKESPPEGFALYLQGVGKGFVYANTRLRSQKREELFCAKGMPTNADYFLSIFEMRLEVRREDYEAMAKKYSTRIPVEVVLFDGLEATFSCT